MVVLLLNRVLDLYRQITNYTLRNRFAFREVHWFRRVLSPLSSFAHCIESCIATTPEETTQLVITPCCSSGGEQGDVVVGPTGRCNSTYTQQPNKRWLWEFINGLDVLRAHSWHYSVDHGCKHKKPRETGHRLGVATSLSSPPPPEPFISTAAGSQRRARSRQQVFGKVGKCVWSWVPGEEEFHYWNHLLSVLWFMVRDNTRSSSSYGFFQRGFLVSAKTALQRNIMFLWILFIEALWYRCWA